MNSEISMLYNRDTYLNKCEDMIINRMIVEYDLKSANTSLCREYKLLPIESINKIDEMKKSDRVKTIGKLMRKDKEFKKGLKDAFVDIRRRFFEENGIKDDDILSIKKDAIFCLKTVPREEFGYCRFVPKNKYTSYLNLNRLEFYYNSVGEFFGDKFAIL